MTTILLFDHALGTIDLGAGDPFVEEDLDAAREAIDGTTGE